MEKVRWDDQRNIKLNKTKINEGNYTDVADDTEIANKSKDYASKLSDKRRVKKK